MRNTTVLIIVKNEVKEAQLCIRSLRLFNDLEQLTVVLAENASTDGTREWAAKEKDFTNGDTGGQKGLMFECRCGYA